MKNLLNVQGAIIDFDKVLMRDPQNISALVKRGSTKRRLFDYHVSLLATQHVAVCVAADAAKFNFECLLVWHLSESFLLTQGAISDCDAALKLNPRGALALATRGNAKMHLSDYEVGRMCPAEAAPAVQDCIQTAADTAVISFSSLSLTIWMLLG